MNTTPSTASQAPAVSISHDTKLQSMLNDAYALATDAHACGNDFGTIGKLGEAEEKIFAYIDVKLVQANAAAEDFRHMAFLAANASRKAEARATAAEAKLEAIRQGAEGLQEYSPAFKVIGGMAKSNDGGWLCKEELLALLQPQHQADESGLLG